MNWNATAGTALEPPAISASAIAPYFTKLIAWASLPPLKKNSLNRISPRRFRPEPVFAESDVFHGPIRDRLALTQVMLSPGAERLSRETLWFCAELLMKPDAKQTAIAFAKELGTYGKDDRSSQYAGRYSNEILKHDIDLLFQKQREKDDRDFVHKVVLGLIALVPSILFFMMWYFG